jgi:hypothetical protein
MLMIFTYYLPIFPLVGGGQGLPRLTLDYIGSVLEIPADLRPENVEGGRTTAAISASRFGNVLKISEDGMISFFQNAKCIWDL